MYLLVSFSSLALAWAFIYAGIAAEGIPIKVIGFVFGAIAILSGKSWGRTYLLKDPDKYRKQERIFDVTTDVLFYGFLALLAVSLFL